METRRKPRLVTKFLPHCSWLIGSTQVFYSDAKEIARLIGQITNAADYGQFNISPSTPSTRSSEDLPVEDQLERLMQRLAETR
jgi:hypothetical protein